MRYIYLGDKLTRADLRNQPCEPVRRNDGKCIVSRLGTQLVRFADGSEVVVVRRRLRLTATAKAEAVPV